MEFLLRIPQPHLQRSARGLAGISAVRVDIARQCLNCALNRSAHVRYSVSSQPCVSWDRALSVQLLIWSKVAVNLLTNLTKPDYVSHCQRDGDKRRGRSGTKVKLGGKQCHHYTVNHRRWIIIFSYRTSSCAFWFHILSQYIIINTITWNPTLIICILCYTKDENHVTPLLPTLNHRCQKKASRDFDMETFWCLEFQESLFLNREHSSYNKLSRLSAHKGSWPLCVYFLICHLTPLSFKCHAVTSTSALTAEWSAMGIGFAQLFWWIVSVQEEMSVTFSVTVSIKIPLNVTTTEQSDLCRLRGLSGARRATLL